MFNNGLATTIHPIKFYWTILRRHNILSNFFTIEAWAKSDHWLQRYGKKKQRVPERNAHRNYCMKFLLVWKGPAHHPEEPSMEFLDFTDFHHSFLHLRHKEHLASKVFKIGLCSKGADSSQLLNLKIFIDFILFFGSFSVLGAWRFNIRHFVTENLLTMFGLVFKSV